MSWVSKAGIRVNPDNAMTVSAVYAAVRVIAETLAMLPLKVYRRVEDGKEIARGHYLEPLFSSAPNQFQTPMEWIEMMAGHAVLRGNGYSRIISGTRGFVNELWPLNPDRVTPVLDSRGVLTYEYRNDGGEIETLAKSDVFHLKGFGNGLEGLSVVGNARETIGLAMATESYGNRFYRHGVQPSGVLEHPGALSEEAQSRLRSSFETSYAGHDNAFKTLVLEEGMKWQKIGMSNDDAQFLETRRFTVTEIARWFRLPPHMIGDLERATFTNIEQQSLEFVAYSLLPWVRRFESAIKRDLIIRQNTFFVQFVLDAILRGDTKTRYESYQLALQNGIMTRNEVRRLENLNDVQGGDRFIMPLNMGTTGGAPPAPHGGADEEEASPESSRQVRVVQSAAERMVRKELTQVRRIATRCAGSSDQWRYAVAGFYKRHASPLADALAISPDVAALYCDSQVRDLIESGVVIIEGWLDAKPAELVALAT
jgi:HK97 family phage portal protein